MSLDNAVIALKKEIAKNKEQEALVNSLKREIELQKQQHETETNYLEQEIAMPRESNLRMEVIIKQNNEQTDKGKEEIKKLKSSFNHVQQLLVKDKYMDELAVQQKEKLEQQIKDVENRV